MNHGFTPLRLTQEPHCIPCSIEFIDADLCTSQRRESLDRRLSERFLRERFF